MHITLHMLSMLIFFIFHLQTQSLFVRNSGWIRNQLQIPCSIEPRVNQKYPSHHILQSLPTNSLEVLSLSNKRRTLTGMIGSLWDFSRPHTLIGSFLSIVSIFAFATPPSLWLTKESFEAANLAIIPSLLVNIYITGLNQITDVDIDRVNKPYLPIAAGALSLKEGIAIVISSLLIASFMGFNAYWPLKVALFGSAFLGTIYSLPPFRLKRFPILAALCILVVRGSIINLGFFFQAKAAILGLHYPSFIQAVQHHPESILLTTFFAIFGLVIAIMKDVPDVQGDRLFNIRSFSVRIGPEKMLRFSSNLLSALLGASSLLVSSTILSPFAVVLLTPLREITSGFTTIRSILTTLCTATGAPFILSRGLVSALLLYFAMDVQKRSAAVAVQEPSKVFNFYMHVWKIFYSCYMVLPLLAFSKLP